MITQPSPRTSAAEVVDSLRAATLRAVENARQAVLSGHEPDCDGAEREIPYDGSGPVAPAGTVVRAGGSSTVVGSGGGIGWGGAGGVEGDTAVGAVCYGPDGQAESATCPGRGGGFEVAPGALAGHGSAVASGALDSDPPVGSETLVAYDPDGGTASPGGWYDTGGGAPVEGVIGVPGGTGAGGPGGVGDGWAGAAPEASGGMPSETAWSLPYALGIFDDSGTLTYRASKDIRSLPFSAISSAPAPWTTDDYITVSGEYGYATGYQSTAVRSFNLATGTYIGAISLPVGHLAWSPIVVSPSGAYALCTTHDYALMPASAASWIEVFTVSGGALSWVRSISITKTSNSYGYLDIAFSAAGTAYLSRSGRVGGVPVAPGYYTLPSPYTTAAFTDLSSLFSAPTTVALYGIAVSQTGQILLAYFSGSDGDGVAIAGSGLIDLGLAVGGSSLAITADGSTLAIAEGSSAVYFIASAGGSFSPASATSSRTLTVEDTAFLFALDSSAFLVSTYPFYYLVGAPFNASAPLDSLATATTAERIAI